MPHADALFALARFDTPTICNALEVVVPARRGHGFTFHPLVCLHPEAKPIVGQARTATIRAATPSGRSAAEERRVVLEYYRHIASPPHPTITVIEDLDPVPGTGAWWGEVHTHVHRGLGSLGAITNGSVRDLDQVASGFQVLAGKVGPSHAHVHPVEVAVPVTVAGMRVNPGDWIHADRHGAVVVPPEAVDALPAAAETIARGERVLIEASQRPDFDVARLEALLAGRGH
jgi:regulator of RNase E activity RraA